MVARRRRSPPVAGLRASLPAFGLASRSVASASEGIKNHDSEGFCWPAGARPACASPPGPSSSCGEDCLGERAPAVCATELLGERCVAVVSSRSSAPDCFSSSPVIKFRPRKPSFSFSSFFCTRSSCNTRILNFSMVSAAAWPWMEKPTPLTALDSAREPSADDVGEAVAERGLRASAKAAGAGSPPAVGLAEGDRKPCATRARSSSRSARPMRASRRSSSEWSCWKASRSLPASARWRSDSTLRRFASARTFSTTPSRSDRCPATNLVLISRSSFKLVALSANAPYSACDAGPGGIGADPSRVHNGKARRSALLSL
mmetsp:Transcript_21653/g.74361  ORF Transcript_21653/g.74361 Transcript_21653/m.74361 type:complete len:317 (-) Transcript_21653:7-957(-)